MIRIQKTTLAIDSLTTVLELHDLTSDEIGLEIGNSNDYDLTDFDVAVRFDPDGQWHKVANVTGDYTSPTGFMWAVSADLSAMVKNTYAWIVFRGFGCVDGLRLQALSGNAAGSTITIKGKAR